jgi:hypothetical protein
MTVRNVGTEPVLIRKAGKLAISIPPRSATDTWAIRNFGSKPYEVYISGEWAGMIEPGETWPK